jgi:hypothetical protein
MAYKCKDPREGEEIIWLRVKSEVKTTSASWDQKIKELGFKVGDITWSDKDRHSRYSTHETPQLLPENNRHGIDFKLECFEIIPDPREIKSRYTCIKPDREVIWLKVVAEVVADCMGFRKEIEKSNLKVGDITWVDKYSFTGRATDTYHVEDNRHSVNFARFCFEAISETPSLKYPSAMDVVKGSFYEYEGAMHQTKTYTSSRTDYSSAGKLMDDYLIGVDYSDNPESKLELRKEEKLDRDFTPMKNIN